MDPIKIEFALFLDKNWTPTTSELPLLMSEFLEFGLLPQFVQEVNEKTGELRKTTSLTNQISGYNITFYSDKILITKDFKPALKSNISPSHAIEEFYSEVNKQLNKLQKIHYKDKKFNRIAFVTTNVRSVSPEEKEESINKISNLILDMRNSTELKLRVSQRQTCSSIKEQVNITTMINDGVIELIDGANGNARKSDCFLIQTDINTLEETSSERFTFEDADLVLNEIIKITNLQIKNISEKF